MDVGSDPSAPTTAQSAPTNGGMDRGARQTLMIAYDGSDNADRAIRYAGRFLRAQTAYVVTAWQPGELSPARLSTLSGGMQPFIDTRLEEGVDQALEEEAETINRRGVQLALEAGLAARGSLVEVESTVWGALVAAADALAVDLLVTGTRGSSGLKALLRSSVAERVLKHCHRPVFIVPAQCEKQPPVTA
ncbi:universal stress protein [Gordonia sp. Z-3]|uniref:Universal stress protein n=2 Tax=Gordonia TaxID=2053 RepID=A0A9X3I4Q9_9ACTN|nr:MULTISPECIES: universal stress protein [Gordonia]MAU81407.1 universal stress protein UspA [Gordonia sp. (in: high G+C Gram-positive bacteria)]MCF3938059.1 universal stress protein [Gordonia tangerina]MCX2963719.1 universal stress protein [Gordonia aquimaris]MED5802246.1 universal stress protein [Gordonia sp. Z-3]